MNKFLYNKLTTKKIDTFYSDFFSIEFNENWRQLIKIKNKSIADFINLENYIGVLQISSYQHYHENFEFDLNQSISEIQERGYKAEIKNISKYKSAVYALNYEDENLYQFCFEFGYKNKRLFITLTFEYPNDRLINKNYDEIIMILNTIKFTE